MIFVDLKNRTAEKAINGDCDAQILMLKRYERYINKVSMVTKKDRFGNLIRYVDEDFKAEIQMRYLEDLLKCKVIKNDNNTITWSQPDEKYQIYYNQKIEELFEKYGSVLGARWSQVF